jgi:hypothetical protein
MCLGCNKFLVTATLMGRLDAVEKADLAHDKAGKIIGFGGFGHMNAYSARLVLQSVSDVTSKEIDYSKTLASTKDDTAPGSGELDQLAAARKMVAAITPGVLAGVQLKRAVDAFGKEGEHNGVVISNGAGNEAAAKYEGKGAVDSPDGLLFTCTFNLNRMEGDAEGRAIIFAGENIANLRNPAPEDVGAGVYELENYAWQITVLDALANKQKTLTLPGGYLVFNSTWPPDDRKQKVGEAIDSFLTDEELLHQ